MRKAGVLSYLLADHLGSTIGTCDATCSAASLVNRRYYSYGEMRYTTGTMPSQRLFTGQTFDDSMLLYYYGARWYDPSLGMFISADTIVPGPSNPQALNRYSYCHNNPLVYVDPSGHFVLLVGGMGTGNDEQRNLAAWDTIIEQLHLDPTHQTGEEWAFFNWGDEPGASSVLPMEVAASRLDQQIAGKTDIKLIGHSRGGALVIEYSAEVAEGRLSANQELKGVYSIDGALSPR